MGSTALSHWQQERQYCNSAPAWLIANLAYAARPSTGVPHAFASNAAGDSSGSAKAEGATKYECSKAYRPRNTAWLVVSVKQSQAELGGKDQYRFLPRS